MGVTIEVDANTSRQLEFAARIINSTPGEVVARLVAAASMPERPPVSVEDREPTGPGIAIYADYAGHRTQAVYDRDTTRVDVTSGPLSGRSFKTPTGAARAVVAHYKPDVSPNRNGWSFWVLDDGSNKFLQTIRRTS